MIRRNNQLHHERCDSLKRSSTNELGRLWFFWNINATKIHWTELIFSVTTTTTTTNYLDAAEIGKKRCYKESSREQLRSVDGIIFFLSLQTGPLLLFRSISFSNVNHVSMGYWVSFSSAKNVRVQSAIFFQFFLLLCVMQQKRQTG